MAIQPVNRQTLRKVLIIAGAVAAGAIGWNAVKPKPSPPAAAVQAKQVTAMGRLTPEGSLIPLSVPAGSGGGNETVQQWFANEGDRITKGQPLVRLSSYDELQSAVVQAESKLKSTGALLPFLQVSQTRGEKLYEDGAISEEELAKTTASILEKQADVAAARAAVEQARSQLATAEVRSPLNGRLIRIYSWPGMKQSEEGLAVIGRTNSMQVWAQVFQTDINRLRIGQAATIAAETGGFGGEIGATLKSIIGRVSQKDLFSAAANNDVNARVVLVKLDIDQKFQKELSNLSGLNVIVRFKS